MNPGKDDKFRRVQVSTGGGHSVSPPSRAFPFCRVRRCKIGIICYLSMIAGEYGHTIHPALHAGLQHTMAGVG